MEHPNLSNKSLKEPIKSLIKCVPSSGLILDAGCGNLQHMHLLSHFVSKDRLIGIDIINKDPNFSKHYNFILASIEYLPFKNDVFKLIYCFSVMQLVKDDKKAIKEFHRTLGKNGVLLLTIPTKRSVFKLLRELEIRYGIYEYPEFNVKHYRYYSREDVIHLLNCLFIIISVQGYMFNFLPRFFSFLKKASIGNHIELKRSLKTSSETSILTKLLRRLTNIIEYSFQSLQNIFPILSDLSYHYIIIARKRIK